LSVAFSRSLMRASASKRRSWKEKGSEEEELVMRMLM
jgi:hypothetical protein